ncbi:hypothetical protein SGRIM119S_00077 [Streptomyces griseorubiginosus]
MTAHGDESDGEQQDDDAGRDIGGRSSAPLPMATAKGTAPAMAVSGAWAEKNEEENAQDTERIGLEPACHGCIMTRLRKSAV